jgi:HD-GYP domain-containing protein (c-di-GMP phosphodiesterase class II)
VRHEIGLLWIVEGAGVLVFTAWITSRRNSTGSTVAITIAMALIVGVVYRPDDSWWSVYATSIEVVSVMAIGTSALAHLQQTRRILHYQYLALAHHIPGGVVLLFDNQLRFVGAEGPALTVLGVDRHAVVGQRATAITDHTLKVNLIPAMIDALAGVSTQFEVQFRGTDYLCIAAPVPDDRHVITGGLIIGQDITDLRRTQSELTAAYDHTLEGWGRALDLRDHETEGHTQRVAEVTVLLAVEMGCGADELLHIRRGSLLHDIGKIGVPDAILLKPGPLTDEERRIMERHPTLAFWLLQPITYLRPAMDIPYAHHERWDGSGYPRQLQGSEIPMAARIFAVVDVWDAMRSDRPYRAGMRDDEVLTHLREMAGQLFDPDVVDAFERLWRSGALSTFTPYRRPPGFPPPTRLLAAPVMPPTGEIQ